MALIASAAPLGALIKHGAIGDAESMSVAASTNDWIGWKSVISAEEEGRERTLDSPDGELDEGVAKVLIGDLLEDIERERETVGKAETLSTDGVFQNEW